MGRAFDSNPREGVWHVVYFTKETLDRLRAEAEQHSDWNFDPEAWLKQEAEQYRAYGEGDVYGFIIEEAVDWEPVAPPLVADAVSMATWEQAEDGSCWGFYGYEDALESGIAEFDALVARAVQQ